MGAIKGTKGKESQVVVLVIMRVKEDRTNITECLSIHKMSRCYNKGRWVSLLHFSHEGRLIGGPSLDFSARPFPVESSSDYIDSSTEIEDEIPFRHGL